MKILVLGRGRMGRAVGQLAGESGHEVLGPMGRAPAGGGADLDAAAERADAIVDFTVAAAVHANVELALKAGRPIVIGTTGWNAEVDAVRTRVEEQGGTVVWGSNFSVGFHILESVARTAAAWVRAFPDYDPSVFDHHHRWKRDAPSGSALDLAATLVDGIPGKTRVATDLGGKPVGEDEIHVVSLRAGEEPGLHRIGLEGEFDSLSLEHRVRDRRVFAAGAVFAAERSVDLAAERPGMIHFRELVENWMSGER